MYPDPAMVPRVIATVCFVRRDGKVLLQRRAAGRLWPGRLNGPGGKVEAGETPAASVVREVGEETGLRLEELREAGTLDLVYGEPPSRRILVHVFVCERFGGRARGREGLLRWYPEASLPYARMWPDNLYWLPGVLDGGTVEGSCRYDDAGMRLLACQLTLQLRRGADFP
jgi:8-oxo-dGTP diphosphatase